MVVKNEIAKVWLIEDNKLKFTNKMISKVNYNGKEIAVLKTEVNCSRQEMLFKDEKEKCYWRLNLAPIYFDKFVNATINNEKDTNYCNDIIKNFTKEKIENFFKKKLERKDYFNSCELEYISRNCDVDFCAKAKESRNNFIEQRKKENIEMKQQQDKQEQEKLKKVNDEFEKELEKLKIDVRMGKEVVSKDFKYYKDKEYSNGITTQNCFLYLAKQYGINIPLATQGFINNSLIRYDFSTGNYSFRQTKNKIPSTKIRKYMQEIYIGANQEFKEQILELKNKIKKMQEVRG